MKIRKGKKVEALFLGMELVTLEFIGLYLGKVIDETYYTQGLGIFVGGILGLGIWFYRVIKLVKKEKK